MRRQAAKARLDPCDAIWRPATGDGWFDHLVDRENQRSTSQARMSATFRTPPRARSLDLRRTRATSNQVARAWHAPARPFTAWRRPHSSGAPRPCASQSDTKSKRAPTFRRTTRTTRFNALWSHRARTPATRELPGGSHRHQPERHARENTFGQRRLGCTRPRANQTPSPRSPAASPSVINPDANSSNPGSTSATKEPPQREGSRESGRMSNTNSASTSENLDEMRDSKPSWLARTLRARLASAPNQSMLTRGPVAELRHAEHPRDRDHFAGAFAAGKHKALSFGYIPMLMPNPSTPAWLQCVERDSPTRHTINPRIQSRELRPVALERITRRLSGRQQQ